MFIGHYAPALVAATLPKAPRLGTLFVAAQLVDIAFFTFVLGGVEHMRLVPGIAVMNAMDLYHMPFTHSLLGSFAFSILFALVYRAVTGNMTGAIIGGAVVLSHWFLDLLVHIPDLTLFGSPPAMGLGLWNHPWIEIPLELGLGTAALAYYLAHTRPAKGARHMPVIWFTLILFSIQIYSWVAPQPAVMGPEVPLTGLAAYTLFIILAWRLAIARAPVPVTDRRPVSP